MVAMNNHLLLSEFEDDHKLSDVHVPKSLHMAKHVQGTEDAAKYDFGWCPMCAWRYPPGPDRASKTKSDLLTCTETCPNGGSANMRYVKHVLIRNECFFVWFKVLVVSLFPFVPYWCRQRLATQSGISGVAGISHSKML